MDGFFKQFLSIDLSRQTFSMESLSEAQLAQTLGGKGLATRLLLDHNPQEVDPLSQENHLIFTLGPVTDTSIWGGCRYGIFSKSPLTGFFAESYSGGSIAVPMSRCGFDAFVIHGAAQEPVWLEINESGVRFHSAQELWGTETYAAQDAIQDMAGPEAGVLVIGPAGENLVRWAVVENDYWRSAGRAGMGAVMGSKKIKGIAFHGKTQRPLADPDGVKAYAKDILGRFKDHKATQAYKHSGTPMMVSLLNTAGGFPSRYWSRGSLDDFEQINAQSMQERLQSKPRACKTCFMACGKLSTVSRGRWQGLQIEGPEYETIYAFGGLCCINQIEDIAYLNDLCDRLGLDTISAGNLVGLMMEASTQGRIENHFEYGNTDQAAQLLKDIASVRGLGRILAQGIKPAAKELGLEDLAVHVKGMEPAGYDPRALKGMGLAYAVSDRGACHLRSTFYKAELSGQIDPLAVADKAAFFLEYEDRCTLFDTLILCRFYRDFYWDELGKIIALSTGLEMDQAGLKEVAARVTDSTRQFNLREGLTKADDWLPERLLQEPLEKGQRITSQELEVLIRDYYQLRGWDENGIPS